MSVQFAKWSFDGHTPETHAFDGVRTLLTPYGPDGQYENAGDGVRILYLPFHTTREARGETQPYQAASGVVITWDGRLDNREELLLALGSTVARNASDVVLVGAAYERWGTETLPKLLGDWALSIWDPSKRIVLLAKDFLGSRPLYYSIENGQLTWSTLLDPLVLFAGRSFELREEYVAGWLSFFPSAHLTPYVGIHSVPPSSIVSVAPGRISIRKYWDFQPDDRIRYRNDAEYEEHFRIIFSESVRRRLRSDSPVLAELSGGMDSSSIVCVADNLMALGKAETPRLDTVSYFDNAEPNWNEAPYYAKVEERRGRMGCHINIGAHPSLGLAAEQRRFYPTPAASRRSSGDVDQRFRHCVASNGNKVLLSGIAGDEVLGGVPSPEPELADLLARFALQKFARQTLAWAVANRKPLLHLIGGTMRGFLPTALARIHNRKQLPLWLEPAFLKRHRHAFSGYAIRWRFFGSLPSFQENLATLGTLRRQLAVSPVSLDPPLERRYAYLDRDLLQFVFAVPRDQLVRPGQRRSLMRRSLAGIVPPEILNRKRKAFVARGPLANLSEEWGSVLEKTDHMVSDTLGIVNGRGFVAALERARRGTDLPIVSILRTFELECWLRQLTEFRAVCLPVSVSIQPDRTTRSLAEV